MTSRTERLFPGHEALPAEVAADPLHPAWGFVVGRVLEEGDGGDLRWLLGLRTHEELSSWLVRHGERALSRRNRQYWWATLAGAPARPTANPLWPLG